MQTYCKEKEKKYFHDDIFYHNLMRFNNYILYI
jgi:hypothetical protein